MQGIVNATTNKVHKHESGSSNYGTACGATNHLPSEQLRQRPLEDALAANRTSKCGRCFAEAGGY